MSVTVDPLFVLGSSLEQSAQMISIVDKTIRPKRKLVELESSPHHHPQRRESFKTFALEDGSVASSSATHDIVTDAIEALLFDEIHTRETYNKHEKELSLSSLPGVVPISKQLFAVVDDEKKEDAVASVSIGRGNSSNETNVMTKEVPSSPPPLPPRLVYTSSLEERKNNNNFHSSTTSSFSNVSRLRAVSPARMEAAAALVSQSRSSKNNDKPPYFLPIKNYWPKRASSLQIHTKRPIPKKAPKFKRYNNQSSDHSRHSEGNELKNIFPFDGSTTLFGIGWNAKWFLWKLMYKPFAAWDNVCKEKTAANAVAI